jgi:glycosyltransferase involved in cell wall biosynthesis
MGHRRWATRLGRDELSGALALGAGLLGAAALNFAFIGAMGRLLQPRVFGTLGVLMAALLAMTAPVNALQGGTEMFAALHDRFPRGRGRLWAPAIGLCLWTVTMAVPSAVVRSTGWFLLGSSALLLLSWNRGALAGLGRFTFVGVSFIVDGAARLFLSLVFVAAGLGLSGASAGFALGILLALAFTELAVPRMAPVASQPLGKEVVAALLGLLALGITQIVDVFAIRLANPAQSGSYVGAASLARLALFAQMPAAAYALRRAAVEGARKAFARTMFLALVPGLLAIALLELFPHRLLHLAYASRYAGSGSTLRILALAMFFGGLATVWAQLLMGSGSTSWAWSLAPVAVFGTPAIIALAHAPASVAIFSLFIQGAALVAVGIPAVAAIRARTPGARRALILNWRDTRHPQGGGSEVYVEQVARGLVVAGWDVTLFCAAHPNGPAREIIDGVRFIRRGGWRSVYVWALVYHLTGRLGPHDLVIDVKNGIPFFSPAYCTRPVVCLVHHVHREQWRMNFSSGWARFGWWVESRLSPLVYRGSRHVAVSHSTARELAAIGLPAGAIEVVRNGATAPSRGASGFLRKADQPTILCLGRLVPHKRVELVLRATSDLRSEVPGLRVIVAGQGQWLDRLRDQADGMGIADMVTFTGWVDEEEKRRLLQEAWVLALPSVKEGWGLAVMEAAVHGTPAVAFRVGGLEESIQDERTGLLATDPEGFTGSLLRLLVDPELRARLGRQAADHALGFSWETTVASFQTVLVDVLEPGERLVSVPEPVPVTPPP